MCQITMCKELNSEFNPVQTDYAPWLNHLAAGIIFWSNAYLSIWSSVLPAHLVTQIEIHGVPANPSTDSRNSYCYYN